MRLIFDAVHGNTATKVVVVVFDHIADSAIGDGIVVNDDLFRGSIDEIFWCEMNFVVGKDESMKKRNENVVVIEKDFF